MDKEAIKELERQRTAKLLEGRKLVDVRALGQKISQGVLHQDPYQNAKMEMESRIKIENQEDKMEQVGK